MRNPNGYGSVIDLGKNRRNRYAVRITDTYSPSSNGTFIQKYKYIGYYSNRKEANQALAKYNNSHTQTKYVDITFKEVWELWCNKNLTERKSARHRSYSAAFSKCSAIHDTKMTDIRLNDLENIIDSYAGSSMSTLNNIKIVLNSVFIWALQNDVINKNYAEFIKITDFKKVESHKKFQLDEISPLWEDKLEYKIILMYIYTGCRPIELIDLNKADVYIDKQYFHISKSKTPAGIRDVPIANKILPFFEHYMATTPGKKLLPIKYKDLRTFYSARFPNHTPHDTRSTFISLMTTAGVQEVVIQKIVGHSGGNVTRDVYTQLEHETLLKAVNKL